METELDPRAWKEERDRLVTVLDSLATPVFILDPSCRITWCNQAVRRTFRGACPVGGEPQETGPAVVDLVPEIAVALAAMEQGGQTEAGMERLVETRQGPRHFRLRVRRMGERGDPMGAFVVVMTDVSRQKEIEEVLLRSRKNLEDQVRERTEELERLNQALLAEVRERNETEASLREAKARWRSLVDQFPEGVLVVRGEQVVFWNRSAARLLGITADSTPAAGLSVLELVEPVDREEFARTIAQDPEDEVFRRRREWRLLGRNGQGIEVEMSSSKVLWQKEPALQVVFRDIREQRRLLREAEERAAAYDAILEGWDSMGKMGFSDPGMIIARAFGRVVVGARVFYVTPGGGRERYLVSGGYPEEQVGVALPAVGAPVPAEMIQWIEQASRQGQAVVFSVDRETGNGGTGSLAIPVQGVACPVRHQDRVFGVAVCLVPREGLTSGARLSVLQTMGTYLGAALERLWMARRIQEAEARYRSMFENSREGIYACRPDDCLLAANPALARILGYPDATALMITPEDFHQRLHVVPELGEGFFRTLRERGEVLGFEYPARRADGKRVWLSETAWIVRDKAGEAVRYEGVIQDITHRKELEGQIAQSQKLEALVRLAGGVAQDFNNLLTVILGYTEQLLAAGIPDPKVADALREVMQAALHAARLTGQLMAGTDASRRGQEVDLVQRVRGLEGLLRQVIGAHVHLETDLAIRPLWVQIPPWELEQVLIHLVLRGRDAMPTGGRLVLRVAPRVEPSPEVGGEETRKAGTYGEISLTASGTGIDLEVPPRTFAPPSHPPGEGSPLGWSVVQDMVRRAGGTVCSERGPETGSTMRVLFPLVPEPEALDPRLPFPTPVEEPGSGVVLLVEPESPVREFLRRTLEQAGYRVIAASHGEEVSAVIGEHRVRPDLVLVDLMMPGNGGRETARLLEEGLPETPVLFLGGHFPGWLEDLARRKGSRAFLQKPFQRGQLLQKVSAMIGRRQEAENG